MLLGAVLLADCSGSAGELARGQAEAVAEAAQTELDEETRAPGADAADDSAAGPEENDAESAAVGDAQDDAAEEVVEESAGDVADDVVEDSADDVVEDEVEDRPSEPAAETEAAATGEVVELGGARVARLRVPASYDASRPMPLVMLLHGYTSTSRAQDAYFGLSQRAEIDGFLLLLPEGRRDQRGQQFWNGTDACCDLFGVGGDDVSYLVGLILEAGQRYAVDPERVWVVGHSNGGFMAYRLACDGAPISAMVSLAGSEYADESICDGAPPLHVLQIHGDQDAVIAYAGVASLGPGLGGFPGAEAVVERWARRGGCELTPETGEPRDLDGQLPGSESDVMRYATGCVAGASAELWTIRGGSHVPPLVDDFSEQVVGWLMSR